VRKLWYAAHRSHRCSSLGLFPCVFSEWRRQSFGETSAAVVSSWPTCLTTEYCPNPGISEDLWFLEFTRILARLLNWGAT
jgi:hypothetical protein